MNLNPIKIKLNSKLKSKSYKYFIYHFCLYNKTQKRKKQIKRKNEEKESRRKEEMREGKEGKRKRKQITTAEVCYNSQNINICHSSKCLEKFATYPQQMSK